MFSITPMLEIKNMTKGDDYDHDHDHDHHQESQDDQYASLWVMIKN